MSNGITLLIFTDGRFEYLNRCINSLKGVFNDFDKRILINDCQDHKVKKTLSKLASSFTIYHNDPKLGFGGSIRRAWFNLPKDTEYVFHVEEDFVFLVDPPLRTMKKILDEYRSFAQIALKRQPWGEEVKGFMEDHPEHYEEMSNGRETFTTHQQFFTTNPSLYPYKLTKFGWPEGALSEKAFAEKIFKKDYRCAYMGGIDSKPLVYHIGNERPQNAFGY